MPPSQLAQNRQGFRGLIQAANRELEHVDQLAALFHQVFRKQELELRIRLEETTIEEGSHRIVDRYNGRE